MDAAHQFLRARHFLKEYGLRVFGISAVLLTPCFWHRRIEAGDLASHVYNAWLAQLIAQGRAPGLWIGRQWNNVLFDLLLLHLGNWFGLHAAERIAVSLAVLIFFWGAFALICVMSRAASSEIPWRILPLLAIFAYGCTFQFGFFNYYISLGLAFLALATLCGCRGWRRAMSVALLPLIWLAHPLGVAFLLGAGSYLLLARAMSPKRQLILWLASIVAVYCFRLYLTISYYVLFSGSKFRFNGTDQVNAYGPRYSLLANAVLVFIALCLFLDMAIRSSAHQWLKTYGLSVQLYALVFVATLLLPSAVFMPAMSHAPMGYLTERITSVSAVLLCCLLASAKPQKWHLAGFAVLAAIYFVFLYQDTAIINRMEEQVERYDHALAQGQRVVSTILPLTGSRAFMGHIVDRACIGQCFSYGNYEPSSGQFRIHAEDGNSIVISDFDASDDIQTGKYVVQPHDLPLYQIYQCDLTGTKLCIRELAAGELNGRIGRHVQ